MPKYNREKSKHTVKVLNFEKSMKRVIALLEKNGMWNENCSLKVGFSPIGLAESNSGKHYLIDNEGYGSSKSIEEVGCSVEWFKTEKKEEDGKKWELLGIYPIARTTFTGLSDLLGEAIVVEEKSLDQLIRTFGARLEDNYNTWENFLSK